MIDEFKREVKLAETNLSALINQLDKVAEGKGVWKQPEIVPIDIDAAKSKIREELKKFAASKNWVYNGFLSALFRRVDPINGSTGDE